jgi:hypothetical protein
LTGKDSATGIAIPDPFGVLLDRKAAIRNSVEALGNRAAQPDARGVEFGIAAKQLTGRIRSSLAMVFGKSRQDIRDRPVGLGAVLRADRRRKPDQCSNDGQRSRSHPALQAISKGNSQSTCPW